MDIILGTTSTCRVRAFGYLGIPFTSEGSDVDESDAERNDPEKLVTLLSRLKAEAVAKNHPKAIVLGFDSVGYFNGDILEKPKSRAEAEERLKRLSGNTHDFYTGITIINTATGKTLQQVVKTEVELRRFSEEEVRRYLDSDPDYQNYALGYDPEFSLSSSFVRSVKGCYNNLTRGIPLSTVVDMLAEAGYE